MTRFFTALTFAAALSAATPIVATAQSDDDSDQIERSGERGKRPPMPDFSQAAETLGISEEDLHAALRASGGPPPDLAKAAATLGVTEDELKAVLPKPPQRGRGS